jgi:hypothetical protein
MNPDSTPVMPGVEASQKPSWSSFSEFADFEATESRPIPDSRYTPVRLDQSETAALLSLLPGEIEEVCWFGLHPADDNRQRHSFFALGDDSKGKGPPFALLGSWTSVDLLGGLLPSKSFGCIIGSDLLESLSDPRPLLLAIKRAALTHPVYIVVCYNDDVRGSHLRHWELEGGLSLFLRNTGFRVLEKSSQATDLLKHAVIAVCDGESITTAPSELGCNPGDTTPDLLLVTSEDAAISPAGGIGTCTYVQHLCHEYSITHPACHQA